jgi:predicted transcriptional regulator
MGRKKHEWLSEHIIMDALDSIVLCKTPVNKRYVRGEIGTTPNDTRKILQVLKRRGLIERIGEPRTSTWKATNKGVERAREWQESNGNARCTSMCRSNRFVKELKALIEEKRLSSETVGSLLKEHQL